MGFLAWHKFGKRIDSLQSFPIGCTAVCCCEGCTEGFGVTPSSGECLFFPLNSFNNCCYTQNNPDPDSPEPPPPLPTGNGEFVDTSCCTIEYVEVWPPPPNNPFPTNQGPFPEIGNAPGDVFIGEYEKDLSCTPWFGISDQNGNVNWIECDDFLSCTGAGTGCQPAKNGPLTQRITFGCKPEEKWGITRENAKNYGGERYKDPAFAWQGTRRYYRLPGQEPLPVITWKAIASNGFGTMGIDDEGNSYRWGWSSTCGHLVQKTPVPNTCGGISIIDGVKDIKAFPNGFIALKENGEIQLINFTNHFSQYSYVWYILNQQITYTPIIYGGLGPAGPSGSIPENDLGHWDQIDTGGWYTCSGIREYNGERTLWTFGLNHGFWNFYTDETPPTTGPNRPHAGPLGGTWGYREARRSSPSGTTYTCNGIDVYGRVYSLYRPKASQVDSSTNWLKVACGFAHTIGVKTDGTLWAFGDNTYKQCGQPTTTDDISFCTKKHWVINPTQIGTDNDWVDVYATANGSFAVKQNGQTRTLYSIGGFVNSGLSKEDFLQGCEFRPAYGQPYPENYVPYPCIPHTPRLVAGAGAWNVTTGLGGWSKSISTTFWGIHGISGDLSRYYQGRPYTYGPLFQNWWGRSSSLIGFCNTGPDEEGLGRRWGEGCENNPFEIGMGPSGPTYDDPYFWLNNAIQISSCGEDGVTGFEKIFSNILSGTVFGTKNENQDMWAWGANNYAQGGVGTTVQNLQCPTKIGDTTTHFGQDTLCFRLKIPSNTPTRTIVLSGYNRYNYTGYLSGDPVGNFVQGEGITMNSLIYAPGASGISTIEGSLGRSFPLSDDVLTYPLWGAVGDYGTGTCECQSEWDELMGITSDGDGQPIDYCIGNCLDVQNNNATGHYLPMSTTGGGYHSFSGFQPYVKYWEGVSDTLYDEDNGAYDNAYAIGMGIPTCSLYSLILGLYDKTWRYTACGSEADYISGNCGGGGSWTTPFNNLRNKMLQVLSADPGSVTGPRNESAVTWWLEQFNNEIVSFHQNTVGPDLAYNGYGAFTIPGLILWDRDSYLAASTNTDKWKHLYIPGSANILFDSGCTHTNGNWRAHRVILDEGNHDIAWGSPNAARIVQFRGCNNASTSVLSQTCVSAQIYNGSSFCTNCATDAEPFNMDPESTNDCFVGPRPEIWGDWTVGTNYDNAND